MSMSILLYLFTLIATFIVTFFVTLAVTTWAALYGMDDPVSTLPKWLVVIQNYLAERNLVHFSFWFAYCITAGVCFGLM